jgi:hypothetical protein
MTDRPHSRIFPEQSRGKSRAKRARQEVAISWSMDGYQEWMDTNGWVDYRMMYSVAYIIFNMLNNAHRETPCLLFLF